MTANRRKGGRLLLQQLGGPARDGQLGLQLEDPTPGCHQFVVLLAAQAGRQALVDAVLTTPGGDRLALIPNALATSAIGRPDSTRSRTLRRNSGSRNFPCCAPVIGQHAESNNPTPPNWGGRPTASTEPGALQSCHLPERLSLGFTEQGAHDADLEQGGRATLRLSFQIDGGCHGRRAAGSHQAG